MVRWSWIEWAIAGAAAAASLLCAPAVCGDPIAPPVATPLGPLAPTASLDAKSVASVRPPIGKLLLDVETGESRTVSRRELRAMARRVRGWQDDLEKQAHEAGIDVLRLDVDAEKTLPALLEFVTVRRLRK